MNRRCEFEQLYRYDERCKDFTGTAFGVLQTVNTHSTHVATIRGASRPMRNAEKAVNGSFDALDENTLRVLNTVLATA